MAIVIALVLAVIGATIGSAVFDLSDEFGGLLAGGAIGILTGWMIRLGLRVGELERETADLRQAGAKMADMVLAQDRTQPTSATPVATADKEPVDSPAESAARETITPASQPSPPVVATPAFASAQSQHASAENPQGADTFAATASTSDQPEPSTVGNPLPDWTDWLWQRLKDYFTGGNVLVRVGVIILFFGIAFLLKYAAERNVVSIELRLAGVALLAIGLLVLGWRLRFKRAAYALILQGAGIGVLYLTVFGALRLYHLLPAGVAFAMLLAIVAFSAVLAIKQDALALAVMGVTGGFLAPILTSSGQGNHVGLFSYYALLNAGIFAIAWFKAWRLLNVVGFVFTFVIGAAWGVKAYRPELFSTTEPFLVLFFLYYVAIAILYALRQAPRFSNYVDTTLVFGTPLVAFGLQSGLVHGRPFWAAYSALGVSAFYLLLAWLLLKRQQPSLRLLVESFIALGVVFATLTIPLALDGRWTGAAWALEGAAIVWIGVRQQRWLARAFGVLLQLGAGLAFFAEASHRAGAVPVLNSVYIGCLMIALGGLFTAWYLPRSSKSFGNWEQQAAPLLFAWGLAWWLGGSLQELERFLSGPEWATASVTLFAATAAGFSVLSQRLSWPIARWPALVLLVPLVLVALYQVTVAAHPFASVGYLAWPLALAVFYGLLKRHQDHAPRSWIDSLHLGGFWLLASLATWQLGWAIDRAVNGAGTWPMIALLLVPAGLLLAISTRGRRLNWPVEQRWPLYLGIACVPLAVGLIIWSLATNFLSDGDPAPLPYVPLVNPLDIAQAFALLCLFVWWRMARLSEVSWKEQLPQAAGYSVLAALVFVWLNAILLRTLHYWAGVPFHFDLMWRSTLVQASFSIFWTALALCLMLYATRTARRVLWLIGAALMALVVVKLFTIDISNVGGLARIVSFIAVALLMLVIGYVAPVPPRSGEKPEQPQPSDRSQQESTP